MHILRLFLASLLGLATWLPAHAVSVIPLYLEEIVDTSAAAFEGTCLSNRTELDASTNLVVTYTTFAVRDVLKGDVQTTHVIKQIGGALPDASIQYAAPGIPRFEEGQDYVVFLAGVSQIGFSSPIGLQQGRFHVKPEAASRTVANGRDFKDLLVHLSEHMPAAARARLEQLPGPMREMDLEDFKATVRSHLRGPR